ncbi:MAG: beta-ketoacyl synthase N-terminal-like domain-containing protein, partial [Candidatus Heimdallarchaeota archaeon]
KEIFAKDNINKIIRGENLIEKLPEKELEKQLNKNIRRLIKKSSGEAEFYSPKSEEEVIRLAGQAGEFDISDEFGVNKEVSAAFDVTTSLAIAAGLEALKDAGIPLIREFKKTSTGSYLPGDYVLPKTMQDDTGIIFASAFPGLDSFSNEIGSYAEYKLSIEKKKILEDIHDKIKREEGFGNKNGILSEIKEDINYIEEHANDYIFNRKILLEVLSFGHAQFAQLIKAKGPNTQVNSACASATQAIGIAEDWIRNGRAKRVIVISADDITTQNNFQWLGTGFLASGAATIKDKVDEAALPFDNRRSGMIIGMGAAAFVIETKKETKERGVEALVKILGTHFSNSAHHATRLDTEHVSYEMNKLLRNVELMHNISKEDLSNSMMFMSHETYTPKRGGSAAAEIRSLRENFADGANNIHIANTKGFTGHPMGAGLEDAIAIKSLEKNRIPPIANFKNPDPDLGNLRISKGGTFNIKYALRLAAGFGSQIAFALYEKNEYKLRFTEKYKIWLKDIGGAQDQLFYDGKTLKMEINEEDYIAKFNKIEIKTNNDMVSSNKIDLDYDTVLAKI